MRRRRSFALTAAMRAATPARQQTPPWPRPPLPVRPPCRPSHQCRPTGPHPLSVSATVHGAHVHNTKRVHAPMYSYTHAPMLACMHADCTPEQAYIALGVVAAPSASCSAAVWSFYVSGGQGTYDSTLKRHIFFYPRSDIATASPSFQPYVLLSLTYNRGLVSAPSGT